MLKSPVLRKRTASIENNNHQIFDVDLRISGPRSQVLHDFGH
jgi:hypothetical protein